MKYIIFAISLSSLVLAKPLVAYGDYDFDKLNSGSGGTRSKKFIVDDVSKKSQEALKRHDSEYAEEAALRRKIAEEANMQAANRSGNFIMHANSPEFDKRKTTWGASCQEGGYAWVTVDHENKNIYSWGGGGYAGSKGGTDIGIGVDQSLRKACRGGHD